MRPVKRYPNRGGLVARSCYSLPVFEAPMSREDVEMCRRLGLKIAGERGPRRA